MVDPVAQGKMKFLIHTMIVLSSHVFWWPVNICTYTFINNFLGECPDKAGGMKCYNCQKTGHLSRDCKDEAGANSKMLCYKCQEIGEWFSKHVRFSDDSIKYLPILYCFGKQSKILRTGKL